MTDMRKVGALYAVAAILLVSVTGGAFTGAEFTERRTASDTVRTADDFTADLGTVGNAAFQPVSIVEADAHSDFQVTFRVRDAANVTTNESRFTFRFVEHGDPVRAADVACDSDPHGHDGTCTVTFAERDLLMETGSTDRRRFVLRGRWTYDRDFVVRGAVFVADDGPEPAPRAESAPGVGAAGNAPADAPERDREQSENETDGSDDRARSDPVEAGGNSGTCAGNGGCSGESAVVERVTLPTAAPVRNGLVG